MDYNPIIDTKYSFYIIFFQHISFRNEKKSMDAK
jgi:hypothetical protein